MKKDRPSFINIEHERKETTFINSRSFFALMYTHQKTGIYEIDAFLDGGLETDCITALFGPPGSGKTNLCTLLVNHLLFENKKVCYIDTEHSFSMNRLLQVNPKAEQYLEHLLFLKPKNFEDQTRIISSLAEKLPEIVEIIIIDTLTMLYRLEQGTDNQKTLTQELAKQLKALQLLQKERKIPIIVVSQTYQSLSQKHKEVMLGGEMLKYVAKTIIECKKFTQSYSFRIKKHRSVAMNKELSYKITQEGIEVTEKKEEK